jgi:chemotaxis signal transduction protein
MSARPERLDWEAVKRRLAAIDDALEAARQPTTEEMDRILAARARALAVPVKTVPAEPAIELLTFAIEGEEYGIPTADVAAVGRLTNLALLPGARPPVSGVTAWRGELLVTLDLTRSPRVTPAPWLIAVRAAECRFGLAADAVHDIVEIGIASLHVPADSAAQYIRAVTGDAIIVLDTAALGGLYR